MCVYMCIYMCVCREEVRTKRKKMEKSCFYKIDLYKYYAPSAHGGAREREGGIKTNCWAPVVAQSFLLGYTC